MIGYNETAHPRHKHTLNVKRSETEPYNNAFIKQNTQFQSFHMFFTRFKKNEAKKMSGKTDLRLVRV